MKKIATLTFVAMMAVGYTKAQTFSDDFESYTLSLLGPQSPDWRTWSGAGGGADDAAVVNTDNHTTGGSKSMYILSTAASGGPADIVLPFTSGAPLTTGQFEFVTWFKIPTAKTAYFNFQGNSTMGNMYVLDCFMTATGAVNIQNTGTNVCVGTHPAGAWFELKITANFNTNQWELFINGVSQGTWANANNQVWGIDYYGADANAKFWFDDVSYNVTPYTLPALNAAGNLVDVSNGLVGQTRNAAVTVRNLGTSVINSFDITIDQNGGTPIVQNVTGLTLASLANTIVNITTPFTLVSGANTFTAVISNVNGAGADGDASDDTIAVTITPVTPAAGKVVVAEEGTGTWCQWCPRGAVYMDAMNTKYTGYFAPIAVHNGDPMTVTAYDAAIGALIGGYPSALVDRLPEIDPSALEGSILSRVVVAPKAFVLNGALYNTSTRVLDVSVTYTMQTAISGNYKAACVITEDQVTGTGSGYNQANAYSGGGAGPMGGFELLGNPVPAAQMEYNHVARFISPDFTGIPSAFGASASSGAVFTFNFSFTLPASYDDTKINIVGLFIDPTGKIDNAGFTTMAQAISNGYVVGSGVGVNDIAAAPDAVVNIYPNPTASASTITLNLAKESDVNVAIYTVDGALVAKKAYGTLNGAAQMNVDLSSLNSGMYFVNVTIDGATSVHKLVKQ